MIGLLEHLGSIRQFGTNARLFLTVNALGSMSHAIFSLVFNLYIYSLGYRQDFIGLLNGLPALVVLLIGLPIGMAADRRGYLGFLRVGAVLSTASCLGLALGQSPALLVGCSLVGGVGGALSWVIGAPFMMSLTRPEDRVTLFSVASALSLATGFAGSLLGGALPGVFAAWWGMAASDAQPLRWALMAAVAFSALSFLPLLVMRETRTARPATSRPLPRGRREISLFLKLLTPSALVSFGAGAMVVFFQLFFRLRFNLEPRTIGTLFAFSAVTTALATLAAPVLARRSGKVRTVVLTQMASIPFLLLLAYSHDLRWVVTAYYFRQMLMNMGGPVQHIFSLEQVREDQRATFSSLSAMLGSLGRGGLGPIVSGILQVRGGFSAAFTLTSVCYVTGALLFHFFFRHTEGEPAAAGRVPAAAGPGR
ncbi:MAG: MFS transporter [bacterium]|nr:MFS transporter [bacterium]